MNKQSAVLDWIAELSNRKPPELLAAIQKEFPRIPGGMGATKIAERRVGRKIKDLCRYPHIPCLEQTRVALREPIAGNDFLHASYIGFPSAPCTFIAAMAPEDTPPKITAFWRMIREQSINLIICLTNVTEGGKAKTAKYWPERGKELLYEGMKIKYVKSTVESGCIITTLDLTYGKKNQTRTIQHWFYKTWPDHSGPDSMENIIAMVDKLIAKPPRACLVHCSAGVGRTGTLLCAVILAGKIKKNERPQIAKTLRDLRHQRTWSVQKFPQYVFLYHFCVTYAICKSNLQKQEKDKLFKKMLFLKESPTKSVSATKSPSRAASPTSDTRKVKPPSTRPGRTKVQPPSTRPGRPKFIPASASPDNSKIVTTSTLPGKPKVKSPLTPPDKPEVKPASTSPDREKVKPASSPPDKPKVKPASTSPDREKVKPASSPPDKPKVKPASTPPDKEKVKPASSPPDKMKVKPASTPPDKEKVKPASSPPDKPKVKSPSPPFDKAKVKPVSPAPSGAKPEVKKTPSPSVEKRKPQPAPLQTSGPRGILNMATKYFIKKKSPKEEKPFEEFQKIIARKK